MASVTSQLPVPVGTWTVDPAHSSVEFQVKPMGSATVKGMFTEYEGVLEITPDGGRARGSVKVASLDTREPQRDDHLRSPDFFDAQTYPEITFVSTAIRPLDEDTFHVEGDLTIHGVTRPVVLEAVVQGSDQDPWGNTLVALEAVGQINRSDFDMKFNQMLGSGNALVADRVKILLDVSAVAA